MTHVSRFTFYRLIAFGILWFFVALSVESSFIPIVDVIFEHRIYLPSVGAFVAIAAAIFLIGERLSYKLPHIIKMLFPLVFFMIVIVLSSLTYARNAIWQDEIHLWRDAVQKSPHKARVHANLGFAYVKAGLTDKGIEHLNIALKLEPYSLSVQTHTYLAIAYKNKGLLDMAIQECTRALDINSAYVYALNQRGLFYVDAKQMGAAISDFRRSCALGNGEGCALLKYFMDMGYR